VFHIYISLSCLRVFVIKNVLHTVFRLITFWLDRSDWKRYRKIDWWLHSYRNSFPEHKMNPVLLDNYTSRSIKADAVWQTQLNAFYRVLFVDTCEAAFSNYRLWKAIGITFFYIITPYIRVRIVLIILIIFLSFGISGYLLIEC
jgi:hypothetical protein